MLRRRSRMLLSVLLQLLVVSSGIPGVRLPSLFRGPEARGLSRKLDKICHGAEEVLRQEREAVGQLWEHEREAMARLVERERDFIRRERRALGRFIEHEKELAGSFIRKERIALEHFEEWVARGWNCTRMARGLALKGVLGTTMLTTGAHFSRCVVLAHTVRVTGWPIFARAIHEIGHSYRTARQTLQREVAHLRRPGELLSAVKYEMEGVQRIMHSCQKALKDGHIDHDEAAAKISKARVDMRRLRYEAWVLNQACDSLAAISAAFDVSKLKDVAKSVYTASVACVASANSVTVGKLSMTFDLGAILSNNVQYVAHSLLDHYHGQDVALLLPPETRRLLSAAIGLAGAAKGLLIVNTVLPTMSLRLSSAALGAAWVADALADAFDPHLEKRGMPPIQGRAGYVPLHLGLTALGFLAQGHFTDRTALPQVVQRVLTPLVAAEAQLKRADAFFKVGGKKS